MPAEEAMSKKRLSDIDTTPTMPRRFLRIIRMAAMVLAKRGRPADDGLWRHGADFAPPVFGCRRARCLKKRGLYIPRRRGFAAFAVTFVILLLAAATLAPRATRECRSWKRTAYIAAPRIEQRKTLLARAARHALLISSLGTPRRCSLFHADLPSVLLI